MNGAVGTGATGIPGDPQRRAMAVDGMHCAGCAASVARILQSQPGVREAQVDFLLGRATLVVDPGADLDAMARAVNQAGYRANVLEIGRAHV